MTGVLVGAPPPTAKAQAVQSTARPGLRPSCCPPQGHRPGDPGKVAAGKLSPAAACIPGEAQGSAEIRNAAGKQSAPSVGAGSTNLESERCWSCGLQAGAEAQLPGAHPPPCHQPPATSQTALSWEQTMGEAGPTRNRKSGGRAGREEGRVGLWRSQEEQLCKEKERRGPGSGKGQAPKQRQRRGLAGKGTASEALRSSEEEEIQCHHAAPGAGQAWAPQREVDWSPGGATYLTLCPASCGQSTSRSDTGQGEEDEGVSDMQLSPGAQHLLGYH